ncbi:TBC-domain-containing protein [Tilletiopsis washingtonensis]|uniref:TBC-domain-containing protein n=1 Tax=Tilletiopsis washingtonensis TaxID=58919 RepID=A0A316Z8R6_9BASI|nr:TBC-domain-containing protein [Tilletiopsis washingtonensis]PWN97646.1 TBC-domain-containing protein [Tilletiopsis washingtonensis]
MASRHTTASPRATGSNDSSSLSLPSSPAATPTSVEVAWTRFFERHKPLPAPAAQRASAPQALRRSRMRSETEYLESMRRLRRLVLSGVPSDEFVTPYGPTRPLLWKLLLRVSCPAGPYLTLVAKGPSTAHAKIRNDTFRTLATDQGFKRRVDEGMLVRLLEAFVWRNDDGEDEPTDGTMSFSYVQGMNVLAAPFLYAMRSELEAFWCFTSFIEECCPLYVQPTLAGVHSGLDLLDRCLLLADAALYTHLRSKNLTAELYAFPSVLTLCACTPPLDEVLQLWDFLLAFGAHLNILCVVAQLLLMRDALMTSTSPMKLLRSFPPLQAQKIIGITVTLVRDLPDALYQELVLHTGVRV